jgi:ribosomal protein S5
VLSKSIALVIRPTPPGTGVIASTIGTAIAGYFAGKK